MEAAPYDNVEFPVRRPQQSSWSGYSQQSSSSSSSSSGKAQVGMHTPPTRERNTLKLAPVLESSETSEIEDRRQHHGSSVYQTHSNSSVVVGSSPVRTRKEFTVSPSSEPTLLSMEKKVLISQPVPSSSDFGRRDLNPTSQEEFDKAYRQHKSFSQLHRTILKQGVTLNEELNDANWKFNDSIAYEQLIQGMLVDGEKLLLGGYWVYFTCVDFFNSEDNTMARESLNNGRICLTNNKVLLLSSERSSSANLNPTDDARQYTLNVCRSDNVYFRAIPLSCFQSVELDVSVGAKSESKVTLQKPFCFGLCSCFGGSCDESWNAARPRTIRVNRRRLTLGVALPPWKTQTVMVVHLHPEMPLTTARDFVSQLQMNAPLLR